MYRSCLRYLIGSNKTTNNNLNVIINLSNKENFQLTFAKNYSKNKKTQRRRAPPETSSAKATKWVSTKRALLIQETVMDKNFIQREVVDPVWLMKEYKPQLFKIEDAIQFHIDLAHENLFNNMNGFLHARLLLDMSTKKKTKFMDNVKGSIYFPNYFADGIQKEVIAICKKDSEIELAKQAGALMAGHADIIKKFEKGEIADQLYDFIVCTPETFPDLTLIKKKINKDKFPNLRTGTVVENIFDAVKQFHLSKDYESAKSSDEQGILKVKLGNLNMGVEKLTENFASLIMKVKAHKKNAMDEFITDCVLYAPPSTEKFKVDLSRFMVVNDEEDDDEKAEAKN